MFACLVSLFDAKKWIPVSCWMIGKAINWRYDYRQHSRKWPGCNYYSEKYSHSWLIQHKQVYIQTQEYERKDGVSTSNWWNHTQNLFPMGSRSRFNNTAYCRFVRTFYWNHCLFFKMKLSHTHLHILTRSTRCYLVKFCQNCWNPDKDAISISSKIVEGYESYPRGPESAGVGGILNICTCH